MNKKIIPPILYFTTNGIIGYTANKAISNVTRNKFARYSTSFITTVMSAKFIKGIDPTMSSWIYLGGLTGILAYSIFGKEPEKTWIEKFTKKSKEIIEIPERIGLPELPKAIISLPKFIASLPDILFPPTDNIYLFATEALNQIINLGKEYNPNYEKAIQNLPFYDEYIYSISKNETGIRTEMFVVNLLNKIYNEELVLEMVFFYPFIEGIPLLRETNPDKYDQIKEEAHQKLFELIQRLRRSLKSGTEDKLTKLGLYSGPIPYSGWLPKKLNVYETWIWSW